MMNPAKMLKLAQARSKFTENHPKFSAFLSHTFQGGVAEGTIIEITVTKPGEQPVTTNLKVQPSDLELLNNLKELGK